MAVGLCLGLSLCPAQVLHIQPTYMPSLRAELPRFVDRESEAFWLVSVDREGILAELSLPRGHGLATESALRSILVRLGADGQWQLGTEGSRLRVNLGMPIPSDGGLLEADIAVKELREAAPGNSLSVHVALLPAQDARATPSRRKDEGSDYSDADRVTVRGPVAAGSPRDWPGWRWVYPLLLVLGPGFWIFRLTRSEGLDQRNFGRESPYTAFFFLAFLPVGLSPWFGWERSTWREPIVVDPLVLTMSLLLFAVTSWLRVRILPESGAVRIRRAAIAWGGVLMAVTMLWASLGPHLWLDRSGVWLLAGFAALSASAFAVGAMALQVDSWRGNRDQERTF